MERLEKQLAFCREIDELKYILRQTYLLRGDRRENDAEHSWHFATMAVLLEEYAKVPVDILKVLKMILIHDLVENPAGMLGGVGRQKYYNSVMEAMDVQL